VHLKKENVTTETNDCMVPQWCPILSGQNRNQAFNYNSGPIDTFLVVLCYWYGRHTEYHKLPRILHTLDRLVRGYTLSRLCTLPRKSQRFIAREQKLVYSSDKLITKKAEFDSVLTIHWKTHIWSSILISIITTTFH
jgi:hypothetical protein